MDKLLKKDRGFWICVGLTLAIISVYHQLGSYNFIGFDDSLYVVENPNVRSGITLNSVKWAFTSNCCGNWHPLTMLSLILDWELFGNNAGGYHFTNLIFHIINSLVLFVILNKMTKAIWQSAFVAALFALHPLHVESVAWVSERKDVLSTFFWLLTMWAYMRYVNRPQISRYLLIVVFLALGLMSKPMLVTMPFVLLLLDYWPLGRLNTKRSLMHLVIEKIPLFVMVMILSIVTYIVQKKSGAVFTAQDRDYSFPANLFNASVSYVKYIIKMVWPVDLAFFYPRTNISASFAAASFIFLLVVTIFVLLFSKKNRYLFTGWFWYLGTLVPVIGIIQVGDQAMADRYSYITLTGLFIIIAWGLPQLLEKWRYQKIALWTLSIIVLSILSVCTYIQQGYWKDTVSLCRHALKVTTNNYRVHMDLAAALYSRGRFEEAIGHNIEVVRLLPENVEALNRLGTSFFAAGKIDEAINCFKSANEIKPDSAVVLFNLGIALAAKGSVDDAVTEFEKALELEPDEINIINTLAWHLAVNQKAKAHNPQRAIELATRACEFTKYSSPQFLDTLAAAYASAGNFNKAIEITQKSIDLCERSQQEKFKNKLKERLILYKAGKPYIE